MTRTLLLVGTSKGAFVLDGDASRRSWSLRGPLCEGWPIHDLSLDSATGAILAGGGSVWYGPAVFRSDDLGETWTHSSEGLTYGDDGPKIPTIWNVTAAHGSIWAGVEPAGLFRSDDGGATWSHVPGLRDHPSRARLAARSRRPDLPHDRSPPDGPGAHVGRDQRRRDVRDRGRRRDLGGPQPRGRGLLLSRIRYPETGQCVHKLVMAAGDPDQFFQQNHCGVYRSADAGRSWDGHQRRTAVGIRIRDGRPSARSGNRSGSSR